MLYSCQLCKVDDEEEEHNTPIELSFYPSWERKQVRMKKKGGGKQRWVNFLFWSSLDVRVSHSVRSPGLATELWRIEYSIVLEFFCLFLLMNRSKTDKTIKRHQCRMLFM